MRLAHEYAMRHVPGGLLGLGRVDTAETWRSPLPEPRIEHGRWEEGEGEMQRAARVMAFPWRQRYNSSCALRACLAWGCVWLVLELGTNLETTETQQSRVGFSWFWWRYGFLCENRLLVTRAETVDRAGGHTERPWFPVDSLPVRSREDVSAVALVGLRGRRDLREREDRAGRRS